MAKYKVGDIILEDRRGYQNSPGSPYIERDAIHPFCILRVEKVIDTTEYQGMVIAEEESYWMYNMTVDTYTVGSTVALDTAKNFRIAKETEIYIYGGGRENLEEGT